MKINRLLVLVPIILLFFVPMKLIAQNSCFTFTDDYATSVDETTDGTNIYTSVVVDGNGDMNILNGNGCSGINYSNAVHTPAALNVITVSGSSSYVGGMLTGTGECPTCYLSVTNAQSIAITPSAQYTLEWGGAVECNFGGTIYGTNGDTLIRIATTYWGPPVLSDNGQCTYGSIQCSSGAPTCRSGPGIRLTSTCPQYISADYLVVDGICISPYLAFTAQGPGPCS